MRTSFVIAIATVMVVGSLGLAGAAQARPTASPVPQAATAQASAPPSLGPAAVSPVALAAPGATGGCSQGSEGIPASIASAAAAYVSPGGKQSPPLFNSYVQPYASFTGPYAYVSHGAAMRDQGYGQINLGWSGTLVAAYMLWSIMDDGVPAATATLNGVNVVGTWTSFAEPSPCWSPEYIYDFAADVSSAVVHGVNNLTNFPSGVTDGSDPWAAPQVDPMLEGASLVAIYDSGSSTIQQVTVYSGALTEVGTSITEPLNYSVTDTSAATTNVHLR